MKVSALTINALKDFITGDNGVTPYMSGPDIIKFFNTFGVDDEYSFQNGGLPDGVSRNEYAAKTLHRLNGTKEFKPLVEALADNRKVNNPDEIANQVNKLIKYDGYNLDKNEEEIYQVLGGNLNDPVEVEAHFQEIKTTIIESIRSARFTVWVAMAWFTDKEIGNELRGKHLSGVNVQVIVNDDQITEEHGLNFDNKGIEYVKVSPNSPWGKKIMHNKFCVIDLQKVIHGSYNWTGNAKYNNEGVTVTDGRDVAEDFAAEFIKLKLQKDT